MARKPAVNEAPKTEEKKERKPRTVLTPAERIAKMEADLAAERQKVQAKAKAKLDAANEKVSTFEKKRAELDAKITEAKAERDELAKLAGVTPEDEAQPES